MKKPRLKLRNAVQGAGRFNCGWNAGKSLVPSPRQERRRREPTRVGLLHSMSNSVRRWPGGATPAAMAADEWTCADRSFIGATPTGLDVDSAGNVYVTLNGDHQVAKFSPTTSSFQPATFGSNGRIGGSGTGDGQFNGPFDVAVTPDGEKIYVSDSANHRVQQFTKTGAFVDSFGQQGSGSGQFNTPKGLACDELGALHIVDAGNNRIVRALDSMVVWTGGSAGTALGQFQSAVNLSAGSRGLYVADTGNNRLQVFNPLAGSAGLNPRLALGAQLGLNQPCSATAVADLLEEKLHIADTANNRVILVSLPADTPEAVWVAMREALVSGSVDFAISHYSARTAESYRRVFRSLRSPDLIAFSTLIPATITPSVIEPERAQYWFEREIQGVTITFPIHFTKENGLWKITEY